MQPIQRCLAAWCFLLSIAAHGATADAGDPYRPLMLYDGTWLVTARHSTHRDTLRDHCERTGKFYSCEQTVNGKTMALIVFVPAAAKDHYYTQTILPNGRAIGRGQLTIVGARWVYSSQDIDGPKTIDYRTINVFSGKNRIHFESQESTDGRSWKTTQSGDERRAPAG